MDKDLRYQQYLTNNDEPLSFEEFTAVTSIMLPEDVDAFVGVKKKDPTQVAEIPQNTTPTSLPTTENLATPISSDLDLNQEQQEILNTQAQSGSLELDSLQQPNSTESVSTSMESFGTENLVPNIPSPQPVQPLNNFETTVPENNSGIVVGDYIGGSEDVLGNPISEEQKNQDFALWEKNGWGKIDIQDGESVFTPNNIGRNEIKKVYEERLNIKVPDLKTEDSFQDYYGKLSKFGVIPTDEELAQLTDSTKRNDFMHNAEAAFNAKNNGTTFQDEYNLLQEKYVVPREKSLKLGYDVLNMFEEGISRELKNGDIDQSEVASEQAFYQKYKNDQNIREDFGNWLVSQGYDDEISFIKKNTFTYQRNRSNLIKSYLSDRYNERELNLKFIKEQAKRNGAKLEQYIKENNADGIVSQSETLDRLNAEYDANFKAAKEYQGLYDNSNSVFKKIARLDNEKADFDYRVENYETGANVSNILGQIPVVIGEKAKGLITGVGRIVNTAINSENVKDLLDDLDSVPIQLGNVTSAPIANKVEYLTDANNNKYKKINGRLFGLTDNGDIYRLVENPTTELKQTGTETEYNATGILNSSVGMLIDAIATKGVASGISKGASTLKNVASVYGTESSIARALSGITDATNLNSKANMAYWFTQFYGDSYASANEAGMKSEASKNIYAFTNAIGLASISLLNPDVNIIKNISSQQTIIRNALLRNDIPTAKVLFGKLSDYVKKAGENIVKEVPEEVFQQGYTDVMNLYVNEVSDSKLNVSTSGDYKDVVVGTIGTVALAAMFGNSARANINGKSLDLGKMTQGEILTELARDKNGVDILNKVKEDTQFPSYKKSIEGLINDVETRKKYLDKIPNIEKYSATALAEALPVMQQLDKKREDLKKDDGTFKGKIENDVVQLEEKVNEILDNDNTEESTQSTPQPEAVQGESSEQISATNPTTETEIIEVSPRENTTTNETEQETVQPIEGVEPTNPIIENGDLQTSKSNTELQGSLTEAEKQQAEELGLTSDLDLIAETFGNQTENNTNERVQGDNITNDGVVEPIIDSVQQQGEVQETTETTESTGSESNAEIKQDTENEVQEIDTTNQVVEQTPKQFDYNGQTYTQLENGDFVKADKNGVERKVVNKKTLAELQKLSNTESPQVKESVTIEPKVEEVQPTKEEKSKKDIEVAKKDRLVGMKNDYNRLSPKKKDGNIGMEYRQKIATLASEIGIKVDKDVRGRMILTKNGKRVGTSIVKEDVPTPSQEALSLTKTYIDKSILLETSDVYGERFYAPDLTRQMINQGIKDIKEGKTDTINAKRLANEVDRQIREEGGLIYMTGNGGMALTNLFMPIIAIDAVINGQEIDDVMLLSEYQQEQYFENLFNNSIYSLNYEEQGKLYEQTENAINNVESLGESIGNIEVKTSTSEEGDSARSTESSTNQIKVAENVYATITEFESLDGDTAYMVEISDGEGNLIEDKNGDTEFEFATKEDADKYVAQKQRGYQLKGSKKESPKQEYKTETKSTNYSNGDKVSFTFLGEPMNGVVEGNSFRGEDGKLYSKNLANNVQKVEWQKGKNKFTSITKEAFEELIEKLKTPFAKAFKNLNVTTDWEAFSEKAKAFGSFDDFVNYHKNPDSRKAKQLIIINKTNPAPNDYNTWVRSEGDILTAEEAFNEAFNDGEMYPDFSIQEMQDALKNGKVTVYSSKPIKDGNFVTPSKINAEMYAGGGKIYSALININDVAWIDQGEGQVAKVQFMHDYNGEIYGAKLPDGTIYINPEKLNANTAIHEFSHLWEQLMPSAWKKGVELFKQTKVGQDLFNKLKEEGNYSTLSENELWSEALNTHVGNYGEWRHANPRSKMGQLKQWLTDTFNKLGEYFGFKLSPDTKLKNFTEGVVKDLLGGKPISTEEFNSKGGVNFSISNNNDLNVGDINNVVSSIKNGGLESGMDAIKSTDWYNSLTDTQKSNLKPSDIVPILMDARKKIIDNATQEKIEKVKQKSKEQVDKKQSEVNDLKSKLKDLKKNYSDKLKEIESKNLDSKQRLAEKIFLRKQAINEIKLLLGRKEFKGKLLNTEIASLITHAEKIARARNVHKAIDDFGERLEKVTANAGKRSKARKDDEEVAYNNYKKVEYQVEQMISEGKSLQDITSTYSNETDQKYASRAYHRIVNKNAQNGGAIDVVKNQNKKEQEMLNPKKGLLEAIKKWKENFFKNTTDRQYLPKKYLEIIKATNAKNLMINMAGAAGKANLKFQKAYDKIYRGLNNKQLQNLNNIIQLRRTISIDENREQRNLPPIDHPVVEIDGKKVMLEGEFAKKYLAELESALGNKEFSDLNKRADEYFKEFTDLLTDMYNEGMITKESFDSMNGLDYQPRLFLEHLLDYDKNVSPEEKRFRSEVGGLSAELIKSLDEGSEGVLLSNSELLLATAMGSRYKSMAINKLNKDFIQNGFPNAKKEFDSIPDNKVSEYEENIRNKKRAKTKEEKFYRYFKDLQTKIIDNPFHIEDDKIKYKYDTAPQGYKRAYYFVNGIRHQFFMENDLHEMWHDNNKGIDAGLKDKIATFSGSNLIKSFATGYNPAFVIVNTPRDFLHAINFTDEYSLFIPRAIYQLSRDTITGIKEIYKHNSGKNTLLTKYIEYGGAMDFLNTQGMLQDGNLIDKVISNTIDRKTKDNLKNILNKGTFKALSNYSEVAFRVAVFKRAISNDIKLLSKNNPSIKTIDDLSPEQQEQVYNNAVAKARGMMDFNQGGIWSKNIETVVPYFNAAAQGTRVIADQFHKNPYRTSARVLQTATLSTGVMVGLSVLAMGIIRGDEDDERGSVEKYLDFLESLSPHQKTNFFNVPTGYNKDTNTYTFMSLAKTQGMTPIFSLVEGLTENTLRRSVNAEEIPFKTLMGNVGFAFTNNVDPTGFSGIATSGEGLNNIPRSGAKMAAKNPALKGMLTYLTGYDFFFEQPLQGTTDGLPTELEGARSTKVEKFYKTLGLSTGVSPVRTKAMVESFVTSPTTNPFVGLMYGFTDTILTDDSIGDAMKGMIGFNEKNEFELNKTPIVNRLFRETSNYSRQLNITNEVKNSKEYKDALILDEMIKIKSDEISSNYESKTELKSDIESVKEQIIKFTKNPDLRQKMYDRVVNKVSNKDVDNKVWDITYSTNTSNEAKAILIYAYYGDVRNNDKIKSDLKYAKVWGEGVRNEYKKLLIKKGIMN